MKPIFDRAYHQTLRERLVADAVAESMKDGGEYYPFSRRNFTEAAQNLCDANYIVLSAFAGTADEFPHNDLAQVSAAHCLLKQVRDYWLPIATEHFEKIIPSEEELFEIHLVEGGQK
ncbi:MAG: hypothetical protein NUV74_05230 [Candidatus Brocadiaceae bacterium]|nr:hypothetical protein [Candidatus Brocadiaceae bacterium]